MQNNKRIQLVIFDLDGTLVDAYKAVSLSLNYALTRQGYPLLSDQLIKRSVGWGEVVLVKKFVSADDLPETLSIYRKHHRSALLTGVKFLPGARQVIKDFKSNGYQLAVASNRPTQFSTIILKRLKVYSMFDYVLCADKVKRPKPASDLLVAILKKLKKKPSEAVYVGDMTIDVATGRKARVKTVAVTTGSHKRGELLQEKPLKVVPHVAKVFDIVEGMNL